MEQPKSEKYLLYLSLQDELKDEIAHHKFHDHRAYIRNYQEQNKERLKAYATNYNTNDRKHSVCSACDIKVYDYYMPKHILSNKHIRNSENEN